MAKRRRKIEAGARAPAFVPLKFVDRPLSEMKKRATAFAALMSKRRSVRDFADKPVPRHLVETAIRTAASAPSVVNLQPWTFVAIAEPRLKQRIREAAEEVSRPFVEALSPERRRLGARAGSDWRRPFITGAPWLIIVFLKPHPLYKAEIDRHGMIMSVGLSVGILVAALQNCGLAAVVHYASPVNFLAELCGRPDDEEPILAISVGYPASDAMVPNLSRKSLRQITSFRVARTGKKR